MDEKLPKHPRDSVVVTGVGLELPAALRPWLACDMPAACLDGDALAHDADPLPFLKSRKTMKFMSKQDRLAMCAAAQAVNGAALPAELLDMDTMIAMCVGPIPFAESDAMAVAAHAHANDEFSMQQFCGEAYERVNPLLLFACLPNMPAYHVSANLAIHGGYYLTYPSCVESYTALQSAVDALAEGKAKAVLYGGVADQQNFLVRNHHRKTGQLLPAPDVACFLVLETRSHALARGATILARLCASRVTNPCDGDLATTTYHFGPAELPLAVAQLISREAPTVTHRLPGASYCFESDWST